MENTILSADFDFFSPKKPSASTEVNGPVSGSRMHDNLNGQYNKAVKVTHMVSGSDPESYSLTMKI